MNQTERISAMEQALDHCAAAIGALEQALDRYTAMLPSLQKLTAYYESPLWLKDHDDDSKGRIPCSLKRGVLTEDAVYDLLTDVERLKQMMRELSRDEYEFRGDE